ncbi:MAG TPA: formimidoylglutamate deiminase [Bordetella sp.]|nr:formimidoylglutamate deiminase [Bordetella sp.]
MRYFASSALLPDGWAANVVFTVDTAGRIADVQPEQACPADAETLGGPVVPGIPNAHSHAFQRAMAGLTEFRGHPQDSFWTWRDLMYRHAGRITPERMHAIARWLYVEMLKAGYTGVAEFHYLHHDVDGRPYTPPGEMSHRLAQAAADSGIALTLLPVLYRHSGFGSQPAKPGQRRFLHAMDDYVALLTDLHGTYAGNARTVGAKVVDAGIPDVRVGMAFHSLRAVNGKEILEGLRALDALDPSAPVHIHIAEQQAEVDDCLQWSGSRPVQWLYDNMPVDDRWCLVHATHVDTVEVARMAASGAVVVLCPTTEANLGDGIFPAREYLDSTGPACWAIGSDSHVTVDAADELRMLEYSQRLRHQRRAVLASATHASAGRAMLEGALAGGRRALGLPDTGLAVSGRADWVVLDPAHPALIERSQDAALDSWIFAGGRACVRDVMTAGCWRVRDGRHIAEDEAYAAFREAVAALGR